MLGIHGVGRGGAGYYLADVGPEEPPRWTGTAGLGLGLAGPLAPEAFVAVLEGRHPATGRPMGTGRTRVAAYDLTFSAPKSASVLFALGDTDAASATRAAHRDAVEGALRYLERHAVTAVRSRAVVPTTGMVGAHFVHVANRNGDPHLHSHVVMANLVHGADGRWGAADRRGLDAHRRAAASVYEAHLRQALVASLSVRWAAGPPGRAPEIEGVPPALLGEFSSRSADIRRHADETGRSPRLAWAVTRPGKAPTSGDQLRAEWRRRADATAAVLVDALGRGPPPERPALDEHRFAGVVAVTPHGGAHRRDVVAAMAAGAADGVDAASLDRLVGLWVPAGPPGVAEPLRPRRAVVPANHHLRALGARPLRPDDHVVWLDAARAMDEYRARWGIERSLEPLGLHGLSALPAARLADHLRTARRLDEARARLARREPVAMDLGLGLGR